MKLPYLCLALMAIRHYVEGGSYEIDERLFSISYLPRVDDLLEDPNVIKMVTKDNEAFHCVLPKEESQDGLRSQEDAQESPSPFELMQSAFEKPCVYKVGVYWTYEYCHGASISQFHASRIGETPGEKYVLGRGSKADVKKQLAGLEGKKPGTLRLNNEDVPYLEILMGEGTNCDLNNLPRQSRVRFVCSEAEYKFLSVQETSSCEYEVIVGFSGLCRHSAFKLKEQLQPIYCHSTTMNGGKPQGLINLEQGAKDWEKQNVKLDFFMGKQAGSVELLIKAVDDTVEFVPSQEEGGSRPDLWRPSRREPFRPLTDPDVAERFLMGEYCLYGGSGWWKYEFCYGKSVTQYHEEKGSPRTEIVLGNFHEQSHLDWIAAHPGKKPKKVGRKYVSHFYSQGDLCEETGAKRHVEVKLKCKKSSSSSSVTIYLLEPATCEYVLGVESSLICDILHLAHDETGLMVFDKNDFLHQKEEGDDGGEIITAESLSSSGSSRLHGDSPPLGPRDGYGNVLDNIQEQLEQAGENFMDKQKWIDDKENFASLEEETQKASSDDEKMSQEEQDALINSAREAKSSYESILSNIQEQLEQAGQNFMEKQKWLGDKEESLDYDEEEDDEFISKKDEL